MSKATIKDLEDACASLSQQLKKSAAVERWANVTHERAPVRYFDLPKPNWSRVAYVRGESHFEWSETLCQWTYKGLPLVVRDDIPKKLFTVMHGARSHGERATIEAVKGRHSGILREDIRGAVQLWKRFKLDTLESRSWRIWAARVYDHTKPHGVEKSRRRNAKEPMQRKEVVGTLLDGHRGRIDESSSDGEQIMLLLRFSTLIG